MPVNQIVAFGAGHQAVDVGGTGVEVLGRTQIQHVATEPPVVEEVVRGVRPAAIDRVLRIGQPVQPVLGVG